MAQVREIAPRPNTRKVTRQWRRSWFRG